MPTTDPLTPEQQRELRRKNAEVDRILALDKYSATKIAEGNNGKTRGGFLTLIGAVLFLWGVWGVGGHLIQQIRFAREGATTKGMVVMTSRAKASFIAQYVYRVGGKPYKPTSYHYSGPDARSGNAVSVRYLPSDPAQSMIVGRENYVSKLLWYLLGILLGGGVLFGTRQQPRKPVAFHYDPNETIEGPEWAAKPYRSALQANSFQTDPVPVDETLLDTLPDKK